MKLVDNINLLINKELQLKFNDVIYVHSEVIKMTANSDERNFEIVDVNMNAEVEHIENRFKIKDKINAVMVSFDVKKPRKRKYTRHVEYFRFLQ